MFDIDNTQAQSVTATVCENAQLYGATPERDEFDPRDVWDADDALDAVSEAFRIVAEGVAPDGFQLADERESLLWGFVNIVGTTAAVSSRRRFAQRSSRPPPRSPWPAAPAAGIASARSGAPRASPGAGFAAHRLAHHPAQSPPHSCGRSCGARPHFAPHRAVHCCPHQCGQHRLRLRQRAAHDCPRLRPYRPPLNRRGGSPPPASPASIPPSLIPQIRPS